MKEELKMRILRASGCQQRARQILENPKTEDFQQLVRMCGGTAMANSIAQYFELCDVKCDIEPIVQPAPKATTKAKKDDIVIEEIPIDETSYPNGTIEGTEDDPVVHIKVLNPEIPHDEEGNVIEPAVIEENNEEPMLKEEETAEMVTEVLPEEPAVIEETTTETIVEDTQKKPKSKKKK